jgi:predicted N-acetyltransferase YhbS
MGKNFPQIITLKEKPSCLEATLRLIENSFHYHAPYSFQTDFAPLMDESNHHNCFILIDENNTVLSHIGVKERIISIAGEDIPVAMLGGISVDERYRGQGHFQTLLQDVLAEKRSDAAFFLLWSDQESLYSKYGFYLCGGQYELLQKNGKCDFKKTTYAQLSEKHQLDVQELYEKSFKQLYLSLNRDASDWKMLSKITSSELYIKEEEGKVSDYFFKGKGQDLTGIIHEYGSRRDIQKFIKEASSSGTIWLGSEVSETVHQHYQFMLAPADTKRFSRFIHLYTNQLIDIRDINIMKQEAYFDFNEETLALGLQEFLRGILGPGPFEELGNIKPLFLSGLDSI